MKRILARLWRSDEWEIRPELNDRDGSSRGQLRLAPLAKSLDSTRRYHEVVTSYPSDVPAHQECAMNERRLERTLRWIPEDGGQRFRLVIRQVGWLCHGRALRCAEHRLSSQRLSFKSRAGPGSTGLLRDCIIRRRSPTDCGDDSQHEGVHDENCKNSRNHGSLPSSLSEEPSIRSSAGVLRRALDVALKKLKSAESSDQEHSTGVLSIR